jgi:hypothetical protein
VEECHSQVVKLDVVDVAIGDGLVDLLVVVYPALEVIHRLLKGLQEHKVVEYGLPESRTRLLQHQWQEHTVIEYGLPGCPTRLLQHQWQAHTVVDYGLPGSHARLLKQLQAGTQRC